MTDALQHWKGSADRASFVVGMMAAFCECVDAECKRLAFSPPVYSRQEAEVLRPLIEGVVQAHGLLCCFEENADLGTGAPVFWAIAKYDEILEEYKALRAKGHNPCNGLAPFHGVLSYGTAFAGAKAPACGTLRKPMAGCGFSDAVMEQNKAL